MFAQEIFERRKEKKIMALSEYEQNVPVPTEKDVTSIIIAFTKMYPEVLRDQAIILNTINPVLTKFNCSVSVKRLGNQEGIALIAVTPDVYAFHYVSYQASTQMWLLGDIVPELKGIS